MTTLADMTPLERLDSIGMWADVDTERYRAVIVRTYAADDVDYAQMLCPELDDYYTSSLATITPRFDLPRAWQANGTPPAGKWQYASQSEQVTPGSIWDLTTKKTPTHRRFVGEWEDA